jgi:hypothetical protein
MIWFVHAYAEAGSHPSRNLVVRQKVGGKCSLSRSTVVSGAWAGDFRRGRIDLIQQPLSDLPVPNG